MHSDSTTTRKNSINRIEELVEQLVMNTIAATLKNLVERNKTQFSDITTKTCHHQHCPHDDDIKF